MLSIAQDEAAREARRHCLRVRKERDRRQQAEFELHGGFGPSVGENGIVDISALDPEAVGRAIARSMIAGNNAELQRQMRETAIKAYDAGVPHAGVACDLDVSPAKVHRWIADEVAARVPDSTSDV